MAFPTIVDPLAVLVRTAKHWRKVLHDHIEARLERARATMQVTQ